ncbi:response regulator [Candidatus Parabeggiatoa sp. HSG14]|uniref:response regulator n=1 Tax=Candidatus Parabeggiatoa sp. HSG14 TaxID=3055593 RepID=UPI0025A81FE0|nr:response regulator [Thiotrichales bacterium HSG14]
MKPKKIVLIVDDQEIMREALEGVLKNEGYELAFASNGPEALNKAAQLLPDIILLDVMMPGMDGFEVCQRLRADSTLAKVPVIMVTALDNRDSRLQGIKAGADDFISKPYDILELRTRVQTITNLNRYRRLLTEHAKFEWMIENTDEAYLVLDHEDRITYANAKARIYLNQPENLDKAINETFSALLAKHYHQVHEPQGKSLPINSKLTSLPCYLVRPENKSSQAFWLQVKLMEMKTDTEEKYLVHLYDVTSKILADRQIWTLEGQISHKLRTPFIPLIGVSQLLLNNFPNMSEEKIRTWLKMLNEGSTRLHAEIGEILKYVSISGSDKSVQKSCRVTNILLTITTIKDILGIDSLYVSQQEGIENSDNIFVSISEQVVEIILTELLSNAQKFHPKGTPTIEINLSITSDSIRLEIGDDGLTLPPDQLANMWTPYYQGEKHFTGEIEGMGLGLSMVASLIWEVGGTCQAHNRPEKEGIVIELILPILKASSQGNTFTD